ncbi:MAG: hypothetical protein JWO97_1777 [Acidobacteria bacterium]|nr:hypothetical protein [Acidobacteriota bacterium]
MARARLDERFGKLAGTKAVAIDGTLTGVGFFERIGRDAGDALNGFRLAPIIDVTFGTEHPVAAPKRRRSASPQACNVPSVDLTVSKASACAGELVSVAWQASDPARSWSSMASRPVCRRAARGTSSRTSRGISPRTRRRPAVAARKRRCPAGLAQIVRYAERAVFARAGTNSDAECVRDQRDVVDGAVDIGQSDRYAWRKRERLVRARLNGAAYGRRYADTCPNHNRSRNHSQPAGCVAATAPCRLPVSAAHQSEAVAVRMAVFAVVRSAAVSSRPPAASNAAGGSP